MDLLPLPLTIDGAIPCVFGDGAVIVRGVDCAFGEGTGDSFVTLAITSPKKGNDFGNSILMLRLRHLVFLCLR